MGADVIMLLQAGIIDLAELFELLNINSIMKFFTQTIFTPSYSKSNTEFGFMIRQKLNIFIPRAIHTNINFIN